MPFTEAGQQFVIWRLGSSLPDMYISSIGVGEGSGTATSSDTTLVSETVRNMITGSPDFSSGLQVTFQGDFNSVQMSGTNFSEFGLFQSGTTGNGSVWLREGFGSIVFDGTNEVQIKSTIQHS